VCFLGFTLVFILRWKSGGQIPLPLTRLQPAWAVAKLYGQEHEISCVTWHAVSGALCLSSWSASLY
jgi:hypothetical protein